MWRAMLGIPTYKSQFESLLTWNSSIECWLSNFTRYEIHHPIDEWHISLRVKLRLKCWDPKHYCLSKFIVALYVSCCYTTSLLNRKLFNNFISIEYFCCVTKWPLAGYQIDSQFFRSFYWILNYFNQLIMLSDETQVRPRYSNTQIWPKHFFLTLRLGLKTRHQMDFFLWA